MYLVGLVVVLLVELSKILLLRVFPVGDKVVKIDLLAPLLGVDEPGIRSVHGSP